MSDVWKGRLLPGSFRGIPFLMEAHDLKGGRNAVSHEPADRDNTFAEDIGRKSKVFTLEVHLIGDNYFFLRDGLIAAMDTKDSGFLVHPYLGVKEVQPEGYSVKESTDEGRIARLSLTFIEAGEKSSPLALLDKITGFVTNVVVGVAQVQNAFQLAFKVAELPSYAVESANALVKDFVQTIRDGIKNVSLKPEQQAELNKKLDDYDSNSETMVRNPASNAAEVDGIIALLKDVVEDPPDSFTIDTTLGRDDKLDVFTDLLAFDDGSESIPSNTPTRVQEKANARAFGDLIRRLAIVRYAEQSVNKEYESIDTAVSVRNTIRDYIEAQLLSATDDTIFQFFQDLYAQIVDLLPDPNSDLANVITLDLLASIPSIVLAYDLYKSPDNERDILDRNRIQNPAFINGEVEVLSE